MSKRQINFLEWNNELDNSLVNNNQNDVTNSLTERNQYEKPSLDPVKPLNLLKSEKVMDNVTRIFEDNLLKKTGVNLYDTPFKVTSCVTTSDSEKILSLSSKPLNKKNTIKNLSDDCDILDKPPSSTLIDSDQYDMINLKSSHKNLSQEHIHALGSLLNNDYHKELLIDSAFNRYTFDDNESDLPEWFVENEKIYNKQKEVVSTNIMPILKKKLNDIKGRRSRKELEAVLRKKNKLKKKIDKIQHQANLIADSSEYNEKSKYKHINRLFTKLKKKDKREKVYIVANKSQKGIRNSDSATGKKRFVDRRLKKDNRAKRQASKRRKR